MNKLERSSSEIFSPLKWAFLPPILFWKQIVEFVLGKYNFNDLNPTNLLFIFLAFSIICYSLLESYWAYKNPVAKIEEGFLVLCPRPFEKEIIRLADIKNVRESLFKGKQKIFKLNFDYTTWTLMVDLSNSMTITKQLDQKKRTSLIEFLSKNQITVVSA